MASAKRKVPSGRGRGRPPKIRLGSTASALTSSSPLPTPNAFSVAVSGADVKHTQTPAGKIIGESGPFTISDSQTQPQLRNEQVDDVTTGGGDELVEGHEVVATEAASVAKRGRGRPKKVADKASADDINSPNNAPKSTWMAENEDKDDSEIWGIKSQKRELETQETISSPAENVGKRGRRRPRKSNGVSIVIEQHSTPGSATKRGGGRPPKLASNVADDRNATGTMNISSQTFLGRSRASDIAKTVYQETTLLTSTSSLRRPGRPRKAVVLDATGNKGQQEEDRRVIRKDDSATEDTDEEEGEKTKIGKGSVEGKSQDQQEPEAKHHGVHEESPTSAKVGMKRKRDVSNVQGNLIDGLSSPPETVSKPATLGNFGQPQEGDKNIPSSAIDHDFTAEEPAAHAAAKRSRLLPSPEIIVPLAQPNEVSPNPGIQIPSQPTTLHYVTGMDGSHTMHEGHAPAGLAYADVQNLRNVRANHTDGDISSELQLTRSTGQDPAQLSQPAQRPPGPSSLANRVNDYFIEPPGGVYITRSTVRVVGRGPDSEGGVSHAPDIAVEQAVFSAPMDIGPFSGVAHADAAPYYGASASGFAAAVAPMVVQDGWIEDMFQFSENFSIE
ncbi:hypothetical protein MMC26_006622 [Xylographa opegraphella]|nr:hypothetical protein [Xylographa opegraphella]